MKKFYLIAMAVSAVSLWACSKNEPTVNPYADAPWAIDETLPVPIQFGASDPFSLETKGAPVTDLTALTDGFYIMAADWEFVDAATTAAPTAAVLFSDALAIATGDGSNKNVVFRNAGNTANISRYYPQIDSRKVESGEAVRYNYSFIGYRTTNNNKTSHPPVFGTYTDQGVTKGTYFVNFTLSPNNNNGGEQNVDVLWARVDATPFTYETEEYKGFNAMYARKGRLAGESYIPHLTFEHKTSLIEVRVYGDDSDGGTFEDVNHDPVFTVSELRCNPVWVSARLNLSTGDLYPANRASKVTGTLLVQDENGDNVTPVAVTAHTSTAIGDGIFILPGERSADEAVTIGFTLNHPEGTTKYETKLALPVYDDTDMENVIYGYLPGYKYVYTINIKSLEEISITASLNGYNTYAGAYANGGDSTAIVLE